jgi:hypothetical protein
VDQQANDRKRRTEERLTSRLKLLDRFRPISPTHPPRVTVTADRFDTGSLACREGFADVPPFALRTTEETGLERDRTRASADDDS